jgi:hypothetical protein
MVDIDTLLPERACRETSWFVAFDPQSLRFPRCGSGASSRRRRLLGFRISVGGAQTTKSSHVCPSVGNSTNANISC